MLNAGVLASAEGLASTPFVRKIYCVSLAHVMHYPEGGRSTQLFATRPHGWYGCVVVGVLSVLTPNVVSDAVHYTVFVSGSAGCRRGEPSDEVSCCFA